MHCIFKDSKLKLSKSSHGLANKFQIYYVKSEKPATDEEREHRVWDQDEEQATQVQDEERISWPCNQYIYCPSMFGRCRARPHPCDEPSKALAAELVPAFPPYWTIFCKKSDKYSGRHKCNTTTINCNTRIFSCIAVSVICQRSPILDCRQY